MHVSLGQGMVHAWLGAFLDSGKRGEGEMRNVKKGLIVCGTDILG